MSARELSPRDEVRVAAARTALAESRRTVVLDLPAALRMLGRLDSTIESLLTVVDGGGELRG